MVWNVCSSCGSYRADKSVDPLVPAAICPDCGHRHPFRRLPLLLISGASGAGKSAVVSRLMGEVDQVVLLEGDLLWRDEFATPEDGYRTFFELWLRLAKNISQAGRPVAIAAAGAIPSNVEPCVERRWFSDTHYLALVAEADRLRSRLRSRPDWRRSGDEDFIESNVEYDAWLRRHAALQSPPVSLLDTTDLTVERSAAAVASWLRSAAG